jgi:hypothetical protein
MGESPKLRKGPGYALQVLAALPYAAGFPLLSLTQPKRPNIPPQKKQSKKSG